MLRKTNAENTSITTTSVRIRNEIGRVCWTAHCMLERQCSALDQPGYVA